jgi:hypothetical protein
LTGSGFDDKDVLSTARRFLNPRLLASVSTAIMAFTFLVYLARSSTKHDNTNAFVFRPYSTADPADIGLLVVNRSAYASQSVGTGGTPEPVFGFYEDIGMPLPTNNWAENMFVGSTNSSTNNIFQIPDVIDTNGPITGAQIHAVFMTASDTSMITNYIANHGVTLGALEVSDQEYRVLPPSYPDSDEALWMPSGQSVSFQWTPNHSIDGYFRAHFTRGSPYMTVEYKDTSPVLVAQVPLNSPPIIDNDPSKQALCGGMRGKFGTAFTVERELVTF